MDQPLQDEPAAGQGLFPGGNGSGRREKSVAILIWVIFFLLAEDWSSLLLGLVFTEGFMSWFVWRGFFVF